MGTYLQQYGIADEKRNRVLRVVVLVAAGVVVAALAAYLIFENFPEKQKAGRFIADVNARDFQKAYDEWGCNAAHPCPNYDYNRFLSDWGPAKKAAGPWKVVSTDSCRLFLTVNVRAPGTELESLSVQRSDTSLGYAPDAECQERKWRWKQFFQRFFGETPPPARPAQ